MNIVKKIRFPIQLLSVIIFMYILIQNNNKLILNIMLGFALFVVNILIMKFSGQLTELTNFINKSFEEIQKVVWPTRHEAIKTTGMIAMVVAVVSILLWVLDSLTLVVFAKLIQII